MPVGFSQCLLCVLLFCGAIVAPSLGQGVSPLYAADVEVLVLDAEQFDELVVKSDQLWVVESFASWCPYCKFVAPEWKKAVRALKGIVNTAAVEDRQVITQLGVKLYPTIHLIVGNGGGQEMTNHIYQGKREAKEMVDFVLDYARNVALKRLEPEIEEKPVGQGVSEEQELHG